MKNAKTIAKGLCFAVAVLMLAMLVMQFMPFWSAEAQEDAASINGYIWMPKEHKGLTKFFKEYCKTQIGIDYSMNYFYLMPVAVFASCVLGLLMCVVKPGHFLSFVLPLFGGIYGARSYLFNIFFKMGDNWQLHLAICIAMAVVAGLGMVFYLLSYVKPRKKKAAPRPERA